MNSDGFELRKLNEEDFQGVSKLIWDGFSEFEAPEYPEEGLRTFREFIEPARLSKAAESGAMSFWGCFAGREPVGVIASRDISHISLLFVGKKYQQRGIASELFRRLKAELLEVHPEAVTITVHSSPYAVPVYEKLGFTATDGERLQDGLRFIPMKCQLQPDPVQHNRI